MCDWVILVEESHNLKADKGRNLYKEIKKKLRTKLTIGFIQNQVH